MSQSNQFSTNIQTFSFHHFSVSFQKNGYLNATQIATQYNKRIGDYLRNDRTQEYIKALTERLFTPETRNRVTAENQLVIIKKGGNDRKSQGTWLHPKLALDFARWLNPHFAVWCDEQIEKILSSNTNTQLTKQLPLPYPKQPEKVYVFEFTENEIRELAWLSYSHKQMNELLGFLFKPLNALGSAYTGKVYSHHYEYKPHHTKTLPTIKRLTAPFKQLDNFDWRHIITLLTE